MSADSNVSMTSERKEEQLAEAEALSEEVLRMAKEAKLATAQLADVKKTLAMFSSKLEKAEQNILAAEQSEQTDTDQTPSIVTQTDVVDSKIAEEVVTPSSVETPDSFEEPKMTASEAHLIRNHVTSVTSPSSVETPDSYEEPKMTASEANLIRNHVGSVPYKKGAIEGFFDDIGLDKACGYDDESLGIVPRAVPAHFEAAVTKGEGV